MIGDATLFSSLKDKKHGSNVTFGDGSKGKIVGIGNVGNPSKLMFKDVLFVSGLSYNLLSISQLIDKGYMVAFEGNECLIKDSLNKIVLKGIREGNIYALNLNSLCVNDATCLVVNDNSMDLWHRRLGHINTSTISKLIKKNLIRGVPKLNLNELHMCDACIRGKQVRESFKSKQDVTMTRPLELLHLDLFGPSRVKSLGGKSYAFVIVDDFSRFTWCLFISHKSDALHVFDSLVRKLQNQQNACVIKIRSDHGGEFDNSGFGDLCDKFGISHNYFAPRSPQQNGVVERKNRSLQEIGRTMLIESGLTKSFWAEAINHAYYVLNRLSIRKGLNKTPYELLHGKTPKVDYLRPFWCKCYILNTKYNLDKFDAKSDVGYLVGFSSTSRAYRVYNSRIKW